MLDYLTCHYEDIEKEINVPSLSDLKNKLQKLNIGESIIRNILESIYARDMKIIESAYLLGASDREQMLK